MQLLKCFLLLITSVFLPLSARDTHLTQEQSEPADLLLVFVPTSSGSNATWIGQAREPDGNIILSSSTPLSSPNGSIAELVLHNPSWGEYQISFIVTQGGPSFLGECRILRPDFGRIGILQPSRMLSLGDMETFCYQYQPK